MEKSKLKIMISAAEASSDAHGAKLLEALKIQCPGVVAFGIGGPKLMAAGLEPIADARNLLAMGFFEVVVRLPSIFQAYVKLVREIEKRKPDVAVVIDYPDFHLRLARALQKKGIPVIDYIPPKVWAWRQKRVRILRERFVKVLGILPFEVEFFRKNGVPIEYVGNPLLDELPLSLAVKTARDQKGFGVDETMITLMPGSRPAELKRHLFVMLEGAAHFAKRSGRKIKVLVPFPETCDFGEQQKRVKEWCARHRPTFEIVCSRGDAHICMRASDAGIIKSGTSTLEAALLGLPHVIVYKTSRLTEWIFYQFINYTGAIGLANLIYGGKGLVPEIVGQSVTGERLSHEIETLLNDVNLREKMLLGFKSITSSLRVGSISPSQTAANAVITVARNSFVPRRFEMPWSMTKWIGSMAWSIVNQIRRAFSTDGFRARARVVSVGNIQAGGAGKTPLVAFLANEAIKRSKSVAILTRGYRSAWEKTGGLLLPGESVSYAGDEAQLLRALCPLAWIGVGANRVASYKKITERLGREPDLVILDDGFQNNQLIKDYEILAVTSALRGQTYFREFYRTVNGADLIILTKGTEIPTYLSGSPLPCLKAEYRSVPLTVDGQKLEPQDSEKSLYLISGIADPADLFAKISGQGYTIAAHKVLPDHAEFDKHELRKWLDEARAKQQLLSCTGKDWVKWKPMIPPERFNEILVFETQVHIENLNLDRVFN